MNFIRCSHRAFIVWFFRSSCLRPVLAKTAKNSEWNMNAPGNMFEYFINQNRIQNSNCIRASWLLAVAKPIFFFHYIAVRLWYHRSFVRLCPTSTRFDLFRTACMLNEHTRNPFLFSTLTSSQKSITSFQRTSWNEQTTKITRRKCRMNRITFYKL